VASRFGPCASLRSVVKGRKEIVYATFEIYSVADLPGGKFGGRSLALRNRYAMSARAHTARRRGDILVMTDKLSAY